MSRVHYFPVTVFLLFHILFIGTLLASIAQNHTIAAAIPYISYTAISSPESCIFSQFVNMGCVLLGIVLYIRYRQIEQLTFHCIELVKPLKNLNVAGVWLGIASSLGLSIVANFQVTNVRMVHIFGALMCFGLGAVYFWVQTAISYKARQYTGTIRMAHFRLFVTIMVTVFFIVLMLTGFLSNDLSKDEGDWIKSVNSDIIPAGYKLFAYKLHILSSCSEWIVSSMFCFYMLSFYDEFRLISFDRPTIMIHGCGNFQQEQNELSIIP